MAYPIARVLDLLFGKHVSKRYSEEDLKTLVELHNFEFSETKASYKDEDASEISDSSEIPADNIMIENKTLSRNNPQLFSEIADCTLCTTESCTSNSSMFFSLTEKEVVKSKGKFKRWDLFEDTNRSDNSDSDSDLFTLSNTSDAPLSNQELTSVKNMISDSDKNTSSNIYMSTAN